MEEILATIEERLGRLEAVVNRAFSIDENACVKRPEAARFLRLSLSTFIRRQKTDKHFPKPETAHGRDHWRISALKAYDYKGRFMKD